MNNVLIALSNYYNKLYFPYIESILCEKIDCCYLLNYDYNPFEIQELKEMDFGFELKFIKSLDEIENVKHIFLTRNNEMTYNKIYEIAKKFSSKVIEINNINTKQEKNSLININSKINFILKNKTIVLIGGIADINIQINLEIFLYDKLNKEDVNVVSFFSQNMYGIFNEFSFDELLLMSKNEYNFSDDINNRLSNADVIIIGLPGNVSKLNNHLTCIYPLLINEINPDCFVIAATDDYDKESIEHINFMFNCNIDMVCLLGYKQLIEKDGDYSKIDIFSTKSSKERFIAFEKYYDHIIEKITIPENISKINFDK